MVTMVTKSTTSSAPRWSGLTSMVGMRRHLLLPTILLVSALFSGGAVASRQCVGALDNNCDIDLCFDAIDTARGTITSGCATRELCVEMGCELTVVANGTELFICCCENDLCNGKSRGLIQARFHMWKQGNYKTQPRIGNLMADQGRISTRHLANNTPTESTKLLKVPSGEAEMPGVERPAAPGSDANTVQGKSETTAENTLSVAPQPVQPPPADTSITTPSSRRAEDERIDASDLAAPHALLPIATTASIAHSDQSTDIDSNAILVPIAPLFTTTNHEEDTPSTTTIRPTTSTPPPTTTSSTTTTTTTTTSTTTTPVLPSTSTTSTTTSTLPSTTTDTSRVHDSVPMLLNPVTNTTTPNLSTNATDHMHDNDERTTTTTDVLPSNLILEEEKYEDPVTTLQTKTNEVGAVDAPDNASFPWWIIGVLFLGALLVIFTVGSALIVIRERRSDSATLTGNVEEPRNIDPLLTHRSGD